MKRSKPQIVIQLLMVLLLTLASTSCTNKQEKIQKFLAKGDSLMEQGDPVRAVLEYKNALQLDPKNGTAALKLGKAYLVQREFKKAFGAFNTAIINDPDLDEARLEKASILVMARQADEAMKELEQIKDPDKFKQRIATLKGQILLLQKRYDEAIEVLRSAPETDARTAMLLALCFKETGQIDKMKEYVDKWREARPKEPGPYLFMAKFEATRGNRQEAARQIDEMVKANPSDLRLRLLQAKLLEGLGLMDEAAAAYEKLPDQPEMMRARADFYLRTGNMESAERVLKQALQKDPKDVEARIKLARVFVLKKRTEDALKLLDEVNLEELSQEDREKILLSKAELKAGTGQLDEAKALCEQVLEKNQGSNRAHLLIGRILMIKRQLDEAEVHLKQAAVGEPENVKAQLLLAQCQLLNKKQSSAGDTLKSALKREPSSEQLRLALVRYHLIRGERDRALEVLEKGIEIKPDSLILLKTAGELEAALKNYDRAQRYFRRLMEQSPDDSTGPFLMGRLMLVQKKYDEAVKWFQKAYETKNGWQRALPALLDTYVRKNEIDKAISLASTEVKKHPDSALVRYYMGRILEFKGDLDGAEAAYNKATELAPKWPGAYRGLARLYLQKGKIKEAISKLETLYAKSPSFITGMNLAVLYEYDEQYEKSIRTYRDLMDRFGRVPVLLNNLAYIYAEHSQETNELEGARDLISEALAKDPENPGFLDTAGWLEYKLGNKDAAWTYLQKAIQNGADSGIILLHGAIIAHDLGHNELAKDYLEKAMQEQLNPRIRKQAQELMRQWS